MKAINVDERDSQDLETLGRASLQVVHDIKNQINGLKLYATFLRRRMERDERPADERETLAKLIQGLDRTAEDAGLIVRFARPLETRRHPVDLRIALRGLVKQAETAAPLNGEFDAQLLTEAIRLIVAGIAAFTKVDNEKVPTPDMRIENNGVAPPRAVIEWTDIQLPHDDGESLFHSLMGSGGLRFALAAKIIEAHDGTVDHDRQSLRVRLPLNL